MARPASSTGVKSPVYTSETRIVTVVNVALLDIQERPRRADVKNLLDHQKVETTAASYASLSKDSLRAAVDQEFAAGRPSEANPLAQGWV